MTELNLSPSDRERLADEMGVEPEDVNALTLGGYVEELREMGHGGEAARLIPYLGDHADYADHSLEEATWTQFEQALGLADESVDRQYADDEESETFNRLRPYLGLEEDA